MATVVAIDVPADLSPVVTQGAVTGCRNALGSERCIGSEAEHAVNFMRFVAEEVREDVLANETEDLMQRTVSLVEILHDNYDNFLTLHKAGEFDQSDLVGFKNMLVEYANLNERTADMFRQIAQILALGVVPDPRESHIHRHAHAKR